MPIVLPDHCRTMPAYDAHVRAFVMHWAPHEVDGAEDELQLWKVVLNASLRMVAAMQHRWMRVVQAWSMHSVPAIGSTAMVAFAVAERGEWTFDFMRENGISSAEGCTQQEWDSMMP